MNNKDLYRPSEFDKTSFEGNLQPGWDVELYRNNVLIDSKMKAGRHQINWNGDNMTSGIYFYQLQAGDFTSTKRMVLMK